MYTWVVFFVQSYEFLSISNETFTVTNLVIRLNNWSKGFDVKGNRSNNNSTRADDEGLRPEAKGSGNAVKPKTWSDAQTHGAQ